MMVQHLLQEVGKSRLHNTAVETLLCQSLIAFSIIQQLQVMYKPFFKKMSFFIFEHLFFKEQLPVLIMIQVQVQYLHHRLICNISIMTSALEEQEVSVQFAFLQRSQEQEQQLQLHMESVLDQLDLHRLLLWDQHAQVEWVSSLSQREFTKEIKLM